MSSSSFKKTPGGAPQGYRTPSPPPVELISPTSAHAIHAPLFLDTTYGDEVERKSQAATLGAYRNSGYDTESEDDVIGAPTSSNPIPAATSPDGQVTAGNRVATIDALATIALATSPKYAAKPSQMIQSGSFSPQRPLILPSHRPIALPTSHLTYVGRPEIEERPSKRARSEAVGTSTQVVYQRPTTSYVSNNLWSPISPQTHWSHGASSKSGEYSSSNSMSNDAELLLNLARATTFSPDTNISRGFPLVNGEHPSPKTVPSRPQIPHEHEKAIEEPQTPIALEIGRQEHSPKRSTEGLSMLDGAQATAEEPNFVRPIDELDPTQSEPVAVGENAARNELETSPSCLSVLHPVKDSIEVGVGENSHDTTTPTDKVRPSQRGWPRGKPRGPRATWTSQKSGKNASGGSSGSASKSRRQATRRKGARDVDILRAAQARGYGDKSPPVHRRQASLPPVLQEPSKSVKRRHSTSDILAAIDGRLCMSKGKPSKPISGLGASANTKRLKSLQSATCAKCNFTRNTLARDNDFDATSWISCDGCKSWFHFACAGFKSEREVRSVDKYICRDCRPKSGPTTCKRNASPPLECTGADLKLVVRKSTRAHTAIDYAGLNEGVVKSSDENHEHHYIKPIKEGTITFLPENFARMRPELVTAEFFEKGNGMKEPVVIPAWMNPRPPDPAAPTGSKAYQSSDEVSRAAEQVEHDPNIELSRDYEYGYAPDEGQDALDMVIPQNLTVRRVAELYGPEEKVEVIDVKSQEGEDKKWNMRRWADYYESTGEKVVRNVISLEVSSSKLGRLIKRPEIVRNLDLQDSVWPAEALAKGEFPRVQFYCLMSVADCFTDFHIDFGGSSVFYHILKGKKTFLFIPPKNKHLKKYEEWCLSPAQNWTFLPDQTKECYRVDLSEGDTMLIPSGWIHAVWTPENSLVIGGNFLTRMHFGMQIRIAEIEKNTKVARKFRYPHFQKIQWLTAIRYMEEDPVPGTVVHAFYNGQSFYREVPAYYEFDKFGTNSKAGPENYHARYYSQYELEGLPELARYLLRTALISMGSINDGITTETRNAVARSIPKGHGEPLEIAKKFAMWLSWKRGNETIPHWAYPDAVPASSISGANEKKLSAAAIKRLEREAAIEAYRVAPERQSARKQQAEAAISRLAAASAKNGTSNVDSNPVRKVGSKSHKAKSKLNQANDVSPSKQNPLSTPKTSVLGPKRIACDACRKRRVKCKHKGPDEALPGDVRRNTAIAVVITKRSKDAQDHHTLSIDDQSLPELHPKIADQDVAEKDMVLHEAQGDNVTVEVWKKTENSPSSVTDRTDQQQVPRMPTATMQSSPASLKSSLHPSHSRKTKKQPVTGAVLVTGETPHGKKGRNKACNDCRKSKRRCVHDETGNVDPIKAQEVATPRGPSMKKRPDGNVTDSDVRSSKRQKIYDEETLNRSDPFADLMSSRQDYAIQDNLRSIDTHQELAADAELCYSRALSPMDATTPVIGTDSTLNNTIRVEPVDRLMDQEMEITVDSSINLTQGQSQQFTSPPDSAGQSDSILQADEEQELNKQACRGREPFDVVEEMMEDEVQLVDTPPSPPAHNPLPKPSKAKKEASEGEQAVRQDVMTPEPTFQASKAPVQGAVQSIEPNEGPPPQSRQTSSETHSTEQRSQGAASLSGQQSSPSQSRPTKVTAFSPPLTPVQNGVKPEPIASMLSRRSSRQPKEIQRFATEQQSNGIHTLGRARRRSSNAPQTNGTSWSPELQPRKRSSTKKVPLHRDGCSTQTPKSESGQRSNGRNGVMTNGVNKRSSSEAKYKARGSTSEASVEEDKDMKLAREFAEMEFGLRRRGVR
ncbi:MAG: hypothetical protein M1812_002820 [Candelaria pacifica]|nr:MAG: hypothetical protein M1812_002820 [Candelaria pacifica]